MKKNRVVIATAGTIFMLFLFLGEQAHAAHQREENPAKLSSSLIGDYYFVDKHHDSAFEGQNGFVIRRAYLTYDKTLNERFAARFQFETNQNDYSVASATMTPFLKQAYLSYKRSLKTLYVGLSGTPTWDIVEWHWGYRFIEKTPLDLQKLGNSADGGLAIKGHLDSQKKWGYHFMAGNGSGVKSETNEGKKFYLALTATPTKRGLFQIYGDYEKNKSGTSDEETSVLQGFAGLKGERGRSGVLFAKKTTKNGGNKSAIELSSIYGVTNLNEGLALFARVDWLSDPNPKADEIAYLRMAKAKNTLAILGLEFKVDDNVRIAPNLEAVLYSDKTIDPDLIPRLTFYYTF